MRGKRSLYNIIASIAFAPLAFAQSSNFVVNEAQTTPIQSSSLGKAASAAVNRYGGVFIAGVSTPITVSGIQTPITANLNAATPIVVSSVQTPFFIYGIQTPISVSASASWATPNAPTWSNATYAYTSITASYTTALSNSNALKFCRVMNKTDQDLLVSFDAGTTGVLILASTSDYFDFAANGKAPASNIQVKHNGVAPTGNNLYISCYY